MSVEREKIILRNLQYDEVFLRKVIPFMKQEYFLQEDDRLYFTRLEKYFNKYNTLPTKEAMMLDFQDLKEKQTTVESAMKMAEDFSKENKKPVDFNWLVNEAETFCQDKALYLAMMEAIKIMETDKDRLARTQLPDIMNKAVQVCFDSNVGHNYLLESDKRYEFYHTKSNKIKFHLESLNKVTNGGAERKTLNCVAAGTNAGKSILLCDLAANYMKSGLNVLYITLEMADMKIAQRIDANLMDVAINDIDKIPKIQWDERVASIRAKCKGKLIVKEYPTSGANASHFRFLIRELKQKQNFVPDVICVDYINICSSVRYKNAAESYGYMKGVTEEIRGLMMENDAIGWTGVQFNRAGINNSDADMTNTGESMGIVHTLDFLIALIATEDLITQGQVMIKQLKSRYGDVNTNQRFLVGLDRPKMRFFELNNSALTSNAPFSKAAPNRSAPSSAKAASAAPNKPIKGVKI